MFRRSAICIGVPTISLARAMCGGSQPALEPAFSPDEFRKFKITNISQMTHDTRQFRVALPTKDSQVGMTVSSCIMIKGVDKDGKEASRPYTPTTTNDERGHFDLVIKGYPTGNVSKYLHTLKVGDNIEVKGPFQKLEYKPNMKKKIGMIAGGSGLTPCLQVIKEILKNSSDKTEVHLVFANNSPDDIILKEELDQLMKKHKNFKVTYVVKDIPTGFKKPKEWYTGFVTADCLRATMPSPSSDHLIYVCGPPPMMKAISGDKVKKDQGPLSGLLKDLGYTEEMVYKF